MTAYRIGRVGKQWRNFKPPIRGGVFRLPEGEKAVVDEKKDGLPTVSVLSVDGDVVDMDEKDESIGCRRRISDPESRPTFEPELLRCPSPSPSTMSSNMSNTSTKSRDDHIQDAMDAEVEECLAKYPSPDPTTQSAINAKYYALHEKVKEGGFYTCHYSNYAKELVRYSVLFGLFIASVNKGWYITGAVFLACFWQQIMFSAHDAGHRGITQRFVPDTLIGIFIADFCCGLSIGWWKSSHNVHHLVTNSPEHDPDIQNTPFFSITHRFMESLTTTFYEWVMEYDAFAKFMIRIQHYTYYPIMLFARFNLYRLSWMYLLLGKGPKKGPAWWHRYFELIGMAFFWTWFGYGVVYKSIPDNWSRFWFVMIAHALTSPLHVQITLSHFAMSTADLGIHESFAQKMLRTTMDVDCPQWLDFFHGGLQFQAIHHLYPRIPRHNLRQTQKLVQEFCNEVDIPYALYGFLDGNKLVVGRLADVARQAAIFAECQRTIAAEGDYGMH